MYGRSKSFPSGGFWKLVPWVGVLLLGAATFFAAYENGSYGLSERESLATVAWWLVLLGFLVGLSSTRTIPLAAWAVGALFILFGALAAASSLWSESTEHAFVEADRTWLYTGIFFAILVLSGPGTAQRWITGLSLGLVAVGIVALISRLFPTLFSEPALLAQSFPSAAKRLTFPVGYWNALATILALGLPLLFALALAYRRPLLRGLAVAPVPAFVGVIYLTSSRGGSLAALLAAALFIVLCGRFLAGTFAVLVAAAASAGVLAVLHARTELVNDPFGGSVAEDQGRSAALWILLICLATGAAYAVAVAFGPRAPALPRPVGWALGAVALAGIVVAIVAAHPVQKFEDFKGIPPNLGSASVQEHLLSTTSNGRWQLWQAAGREFTDHPVLGGGAGSYEAYWAEHGSLPLFVRDAHSLYIETAAELGIVGVVVLGAALLLGLVAALRRLFASTPTLRPTVAALVAAYVAFLLEAGVDWMWEVTAVTAVGIAVLALATGPASLPETALESRPVFALPGRIVGALLAGFFVLAALIPLLADQEISRSQDAAVANRLNSSSDHATNAERLEPWASTPWLQLALVREQAGDLPGAKNAVAEALERDDSDWRIWLVSARIETKLGNIAEARKNLDEARRLNPRSSLFASS